MTFETEQGKKEFKENISKQKLNYSLGVSKHRGNKDVGNIAHLTKN